MWVSRHGEARFRSYPKEGQGEGGVIYTELVDTVMGGGHEPRLWRRMWLAKGKRQGRRGGGGAGGGVIWGFCLEFVGF